MIGRERLAWFLVLCSVCAWVVVGVLRWERPAAAVVERTLDGGSGGTVFCVDFDERGQMVLWSAVLGECREEDRPWFRREGGGKL